ncbi:MAG: lipoprotein signal peptidase [Sphingobacteriales bacterium]|nr:MAG: lipoprotein signal peptidase [Sphingobacteriales bacterium]
MGPNKSAIALFTIFLVLFIDQFTKIWIKTHLMIGEEIHVFDWFKIHFVENEGMAFGMKLGGDYGKFILSSFRIIAVVFLIFILRSLIRKPDTTLGLTLSMSFILAGAIGNIIDSVIYGIIFSDSHGQVATFLPAGGGYAGLLYGKVVDMLHFPIYQGWLPVWIPIWGGDYLIFFRPVFNIADSAITVGVFSILLFQRNFFAHFEDSNKTKEAEVTPLEAKTDHDSEVEQIVENPATIESEDLNEDLDENIPEGTQPMPYVDTSTPFETATDNLVVEDLSDEIPQNPAADIATSDEVVKE